MNDVRSRFQFACAPDSWGVLDYPGPSWNQSYEKMLDEMVWAGYTGTELGPYGFFPTDPTVLKPQLERRNLKLLGSFVPVVLSDPASAGVAVAHIRKVGDLLATLKAPFLVLADAQSDVRNRLSGRVPSDGSAGLTAAQWKNVAHVVEEAAKVSAEFGLDLVFHPHVATYVETPEECERFFDVTSHTGIGLCLDTGHCEFGGGDTITEAAKFASVLRFLHIKDVDNKVLEEARRKKLNFEEAIEEKVFTIIGQGSVNFPGLFRLLEKNNYSGWSVIEQDVKFGATTVPPAESVAASLKYLNGVLAEMAGAPVK
ncbi:MAG TPA: sugar phosphate isomerase/epimerase [Candidatus Sulfotelmatobacter sp.]|nr:sugar phosphate isomerase/epimerase [Candidatus Sulfotelmatobacter sp.]